MKRAVAMLLAFAIIDPAFAAGGTHEPAGGADVNQNGDQTYAWHLQHPLGSMMGYAGGGVGGNAASSGGNATAGGWGGEKP